MRRALFLFHGIAYGLLLTDTTYYFLHHAHAHEHGERGFGGERAASLEYIGGGEAAVENGFGG